LIFKLFSQKNGENCKLLLAFAKIWSFEHWFLWKRPILLLVIITSSTPGVCFRNFRRRLAKQRRRKLDESIRKRLKNSLGHFSSAKVDSIIPNMENFYWDRLLMISAKNRS
jgi:hypothetical protein